MVAWRSWGLSPSHPVRWRRLRPLRFSRSPLPIPSLRPAGVGASASSWPATRTATASTTSSPRPRPPTGSIPTRPRLPAQRQGPIDPADDRLARASGRDRVRVPQLVHRHPVGPEVRFYISVPGDLNGDGKDDVVVGTDQQNVYTGAKNGVLNIARCGAPEPNGCNEGQGQGMGVQRRDEQGAPGQVGQRTADGQGQVPGQRPLQAGFSAHAVGPRRVTMSVRPARA
jgi:hypothetical protein